MSSLAGFFSAMGSFLHGQSSAEDLRRALGPSPSGQNALAVYPWLIERDTSSVLEKLYPATRAWADALRPGLWDVLVRAYTTQRPPRHWDPNRFAESFPE